MPRRGRSGQDVGLFVQRRQLEGRLRFPRQSLQLPDDVGTLRFDLDALDGDEDLATRAPDLLQQIVGGFLAGLGLDRLDGLGALDAGGNTGHADRSLLGCRAMGMGSGLGDLLGGGTGSDFGHDNTF